MRRLLTFAFLFLGVTLAAQERQDTLDAAKVSSTYGSLVVPQRISSEELRSVTGLSEAVRRFAGVQLRDYGGVGGLKTVNVRSLGSEHTGVFVDGIQVDNAQNMQVDLGRFSLEGIGSVTLFSGQKVSPLQSAKEYSSASSLYLESSRPLFASGVKNNIVAGLSAGSFMTVSPKMTWERLFGDGTSLRLSGDGVFTDGEYRFKVKDTRQYADGSIAGYDTTMVRRNCDLSSARVEARLFGPLSDDFSWNIHAYFYGSGRGLPGPVYKKAGEYPLSEDRQTDRDAFLQGKVYRELNDVWSVAGRAKLSFSHLEYIDYPELLPDGAPAHYNYRNHSAYVSGSAMARMSDRFTLNLAQDFQYDYLDSDLRSFAYPGRLSGWSCLSSKYHSGSLEASASVLYLGVYDTFLSGRDRSSAKREVFMPSLVARWSPSGKFSISAFAKRSYRMPTFNDLYYTVAGTKTLDPEDALQFDLGADWNIISTGGRRLSIKAEAYRNLLRNKIIAVPTSNQFRWSMYNLGKVSVIGADVTLDYSGESGDISYGIVTRYTYQSSRDRSDRESLTWNGQVPYIPVHSGSANVFACSRGWRADITLFSMGERYTTSANLPAYRLAPWTTLDAAISKTLDSGAALKLCLNNLLNERYEIVDNYPMPGMNFLFSVILPVKPSSKNR